MDGTELAAAPHAFRVGGGSGEESREQPEGALGIALSAAFRTTAPFDLLEREGAGRHRPARPTHDKEHRGRGKRPAHTLAPLAHKLHRNNNNRSGKTGQFHSFPTGERPED